MTSTDEPMVGVRFVEAGPVSYCRPGDLRLGVGDYVVVRDERGERLGWVVIAPDQVVASEHPGPLRVIERLATEADVEAWRANRARAREDFLRAQAMATRSDPRVRVASLEYNLAGNRADLTFTAPERVEHDWLRRQASELLGCEVRVQQVGDRDRARAAGGIGVCGLALCCSTWMTEFPAISIKMAKDQDLAPNPSKISGVCGRLLCCLAFEVEQYRELRGGLPRVGKTVTTPVGRARVLSINLLRSIARLRIEHTGEVVEIGTDELRAQYGTAVRPTDLEEAVEAPIRERQARLDRDLVAVLTPTETPASNGGAVAPVAAVDLAIDLALDVDDAEDEDELAAEGAIDAEGPEGEGPRKRRRRGRRGGRRRRRAAETTQELEGGAQPEAVPAVAIPDGDVPV